MQPNPPADNNPSQTKDVRQIPTTVGPTTPKFRQTQFPDFVHFVYLQTKSGYFCVCFCFRVKQREFDMQKFEVFGYVLEIYHWG